MTSFPLSVTICMMPILPKQKTIKDLFLKLSTEVIHLPIIPLITWAIIARTRLKTLIQMLNKTWFVIQLHFDEIESLFLCLPIMCFFFISAIFWRNEYWTGFGLALVQRTKGGNEPPKLYVEQLHSNAVHKQLESSCFENYTWLLKMYCPSFIWTKRHWDSQ